MSSETPGGSAPALPGAQSETAPARRVLLKHARDALAGAESLRRQWRRLGWAGPPDPAAAAEEYDRFVEHLRALGAEPCFAPPDAGAGLDSIYVRDALVVCESGAILCRMGKRARRGEPEALAPVLAELAIPVLGAITGAGRLEGGDVVWLDDGTLAVGHGYRTNGEGIRQLAALLASRPGARPERLIEVPLPHWRGPGDVFHLMSIVSPLDRDLLLVYSPLMPVPFRRHLLSRGYRLIEVPDAELESLGGNVLAVAPRRCLMVAGNPRTRARLESAGVEVREFAGEEICRKGAGGPTCLTRPLDRLDRAE